MHTGGAAMFYCGIDVAKRKHAVALLGERGQSHKPVFTIENTHVGLDFLVEELKRLEGGVFVGLEATGHYWLSLYDVLTRQGYAVVVINPLQIAAYRKSGVRKVKNDRTDAVWIADFLRISHLPASSRDIPLLLQLRELSRFRYWLSEQIGDCKRKLLTILDRVFPEYESLFSSVFVQSSRAVLQEAVSAQDFADFDLQELTEVLAKTSRGRFGEEKAKQLQAQARQSIGVGFLADAAQVEMRCLLAQIGLLEDQQAEVEIAEEELMRQIPQYITTISGIGLITGAAILSEIGDISRFETEDKLAARPAETQSPTMTMTSIMKDKNAIVYKKRVSSLRSAGEGARGARLPQAEVRKTATTSTNTPATKNCPAMAIEARPTCERA
jgi:transposase